MNLQLTIWSLLLLFGCFQALILAGIFAFHKRGARRSNLFMVCLILVFAIIQFDHSLRLSELYKVLPWGLYISDSLWYLIGPLLFLYLKFRVENARFSIWDFLHFLPFFVFAFIYGELPFLSSEIKTQILEHYLQRGSVHSPIVIMFILIMMIQILAYFIASLAFLIHTERMYKKVSSEDSIVDFVILKQIILFFGLYFLFEFSFSTFRNILGIQNKFIENWSLVMWTLFMISLVVTVIRFPSNVFKIIKLPKKKNLNFDISELKRRVLRFMDSECPYLNDKLTITELASNIGCTSNQLSHVLNHELSKSFYDFVNSYRVKHAERQLKNGDHHKLSIFGIAQASGFRSKASFYNFFKKEFDTTPKEYIKRNNL